MDTVLVSVTGVWGTTLGPHDTVEEGEGHVVGARLRREKLNIKQRRPRRSPITLEATTMVATVRLTSTSNTLAAWRKVQSSLSSFNLPPIQVSGG